MPSSETHLTPRQLTLVLAGAAVLAVAITTLVVLPAEYGIDPTGLGELAGFARLSAPAERLVETTNLAPPEVLKMTEPFATDTVTIELLPFRLQRNGLEYKLSMHPGETLVYSWTASAPVYFEFHGHTAATPDRPDIEVMNYLVGTEATQSGTLTAPLDGIHGWFFQNTTFEPVTIELHLAGNYRLEPGLLIPQ